MNFLYQTLPLGAIEPTSKNDLVIIGLIAFLCLLVGFKIAFSFMRAMGRFSMMGHMMPPMMGGVAQQQEVPRKKGGIMGIITFGAALFLIWQLVLQGTPNKRSVKYDGQDSSTHQPIFPLGTPDSGEEKPLNTPNRRPKENRKNVHPGAKRADEYSNKKYYNTSPSELRQESERTPSNEEEYPEAFAEVRAPDQAQILAQFTLQIACGSVLDFVVDKAQDIKRRFPNQPIYVFEDTSRDCIKILVGSFHSESEALQFKKRNASKLDKKGIPVALDNIPEESLIELAQ